MNGLLDHGEESAGMFVAGQGSGPNIDFTHQLGAVLLCRGGQDGLDFQGGAGCGLEEGHGGPGGSVLYPSAGQEQGKCLGEAEIDGSQEASGFGAVSSVLAVMDKFHAYGPEDIEIAEDRAPGYAEFVCQGRSVVTTATLQEGDEFEQTVDAGELPGRLCDRFGRRAGRTACVSAGGLGGCKRGHW